MRNTHAMTLIELLVAIAIMTVAIAVLLPTLSRTGGGHPSSRLKDSTQVRSIGQAFLIFGIDNKGDYPLPSVLDSTNTTDPRPGVQKDTTGNILSILIFLGAMTPELCINPAESNTDAVVRVDEYEYNQPQSAVQPQLAQWDPGFSGTPLNHNNGPARHTPGRSNQSYALAPPFGKRKAFWRTTFSPTEAICGNRGPVYQGTTYPNGGRWRLAPGATGIDSLTLLIHGGRKTWEGNIGYNDGRVAFETKPNPADVTYTRRDGNAVADNLFVDETDDISGTGSADDAASRDNAFLRPVAGVDPDVSATSITLQVWTD